MPAYDMKSPWDYSVCFVSSTNTLDFESPAREYEQDGRHQGPLLSTWINSNPSRSMDK